MDNDNIRKILEHEIKILNIKIRERDKQNQNKDNSQPMLQPNIPHTRDNCRMFNETQIAFFMFYYIIYLLLKHHFLFPTFCGENIINFCSII